VPVLPAFEDKIVRNRF